MKQGVVTTRLFHLVSGDEFVGVSECLGFGGCMVQGSEVREFEGLGSFRV